MIHDDPEREDLQRLPTLEIILVRHATPVPPGTAGWEERDDERPLTSEGLRQADDLALELDPYGLSAVYSSPFPRALQTVSPTARAACWRCSCIDDLRERQLARRPARRLARSCLARSWAEPDFAVPGGESGRAAQQRGMRVLDLLRVRHAEGGRLLVGSHGNLISLILQALEPAVDHAFHQAMPMPAVYPPPARRDRLARDGRPRLRPARRP